MHVQYRRYLTLTVTLYLSLNLYSYPYYNTVNAYAPTYIRYGSDTRLWRYVTKLDYGDTQAPMRLTDVFHLRLLSGRPDTNNIQGTRC